MIKLRNPANKQLIGICAGVTYVIPPGGTITVEKVVATHLLGQARRSKRRLDSLGEVVAKKAPKKAAPKKAAKPKKVAAKKAAPKKVKAKKAATKPPRRKKK